MRHCTRSIHPSTWVLGAATARTYERGPRGQGAPFGLSQTGASTAPLSSARFCLLRVPQEVAGRFRKILSTWYLSVGEPGDLDWRTGPGGARWVSDPLAGTVSRRSEARAGEHLPPVAPHRPVTG